MTAVSVLFAGIWSLHYVSLIRGLKTSRISKTGWGKPVGDCPRPGLPKSPPKAFQSGRNWGYVTQVGCLLLQGCSCGKSIQGSYAFYFFFSSAFIAFHSHFIFASDFFWGSQFIKAPVLQLSIHHTNNLLEMVSAAGFPWLQHYSTKC